jgi:hypothetical protein
MLSRVGLRARIKRSGDLLRARVTVTGVRRSTTPREEPSGTGR